MTETTFPVSPRVRHFSISAVFLCVIAAFVSKYTVLAGIVFLSADTVPLTSTLSPALMSANAAGVMSLTFSGETFLKTVALDTIASITPSFVFTVMLVSVTDTTSPPALLSVIPISGAWAETIENAADTTYE